MIGSPLIIAEAGVNHNGDLARALALVDAAVDAGADVVKFQAFRAEGLVTEDADTVAYQASNTGQDNQAELLRALELSQDDFETIAAQCAKVGIEFLCTPFDVAMTADLVAMGMKRIKVASGELTNLPALRHFAAFDLPIILSTGMATLADVGEALEALEEVKETVTCLHCTSLYPAPIETLNLRAMTTMAEAFDVPVGYSDHSLGDHAAIAATALGASVIEKHFTLDRTLPGPDHMASLEPSELRTMVARIRDTAKALGDGVKQPTDQERETAALVRRSWHTRRAVSGGSVIAAADLVLKRPADGLPPAQSPEGHRLIHDLAADRPVTAADIE